MSISVGRHKLWFTVGDMRLGKCSIIIIYSTHCCAMFQYLFVTDLTYKLNMLLLSYHRHLRMISVSLELRMEGGRVSHIWCMCVDGHDYGGFGWGRDGGGGC